MGVEINLSAVPVDFEVDEETGEVTAYNDELRVMAVGSTRADAESRFRSALERLLYYELTHERPLPPAIAWHIKLTAGTYRPLRRGLHAWVRRGRRRSYP